MQPQPGDFFLAPIAGEVGKGIKWGQRLNGEGFRKIQHAGMYMGDGMTVEAMPGGAIHGRIEKYAPDSLVWSTGLIDLTASQRLDILHYAHECIGVPYSFLDYAAIAAHRFHIPAPGLKRYIASSGHMICSQLVDRVHQLAGVQLFDDGRWPGYVTPASLDQLLENIRNYKMSQGI